MNNGLINRDRKKLAGQQRAATRLWRWRADTLLAVSLERSLETRTRSPAICQLMASVESAKA